MVYITPTGSPGLTQESTLILSPHFYWCKKSSTPFNSLDQAKKIAPSLFENDLTQTKLNYDVYKNAQGEFIFLAYDLSNITAQLKELEYDFKKIKNVYLAQQVCDNITSPLSVDEDHALALVEAVVVSIHPNYLIQESLPLTEHLQQTNIKAKKVPLEGIGSFDLSRYKKPAIVAASLIALITVFEFINLFTTLSDLDTKEQELKAQYKLPSTQIQLRSIMSRLKKTSEAQSFIRESLYFISKNRSIIKGRLKQLSISKQNLDLIFSNPDDQLKELLKKRFKKAQFSLGKDELIVKVSA